MFNFWRGGCVADPVECMTVSYIGDSIVLLSYHNRKTDDGYQTPIYNESDLQAKTYVITKSSDLINDGWTLEA